MYTSLINEYSFYVNNYFHIYMKIIYIYILLCIFPSDYNLVNRLGIKKSGLGTSLVVQWLRIFLAMHGTWI